MKNIMRMDDAITKAVRRGIDMSKVIFSCPLRMAYDKEARYMETDVLGTKVRFPRPVQIVYDGKPYSLDEFEQSHSIDDFRVDMDMSQVIRTDGMPNQYVLSVFKEDIE